MRGIALARRLALLAAESTVQTDGEELIDAHRGYAVLPDRWAELSAAMADWEREDDDPWRRMRGDLGLDATSGWLLLLCAAAELYPDAAAALSLVAEDERVHLVTPAAFALLMRASRAVCFEQALLCALPGCEAERVGLVERAEPIPHKPWAQQPLRLRGEVLRALVREEAPVALSPPAARVSPGRAPALRQPLVEGARALLDERGVLCLRSASARAARQLAFDLGSVRQQSVVLHPGGAELPSLETLAVEEDVIVAVDLSSAGATGFPRGFVLGAAARVPRLVLLCPWNASVSDLPVVDVDPLGIPERRRVFEEVTSAQDAAALADRFTVSLDEARTAANGVSTGRRLSGARVDAPPSAEELSHQLLEQGARRMGRLVTRIHSGARLDLLVVPPAVRRQLDEIVSWRRTTAAVQTEWNVGASSPLGKGLTCLFSGPPGTGKTFAAQCLANGLGLNLYRIDLSQVVSKYIGETEKALAQVFEEAEAGHGVLLFDEADALFGKRSEVKDAHDRYANIEVGYLLQRLESFDGVAILTTNLRGNLDPAFIRRLRFVVEFPMPDAPQRGQIWAQSLPPREKWAVDVDVTPFVERFPLSGGSISNIGLAAAHLAAAAGGQMRTEHLVRATFRELEKAGLARTPESFGPLAQYLSRGGA